MRREDKNNLRTMPQTSEFRKGTCLSQIYNSGENKDGVYAFHSQSIVICQYRNKSGHSSDKCRNRITEINHIHVDCQMCDRDGHSASH